jgi:glyoxylase-like metal-dependent hydrolase (beta-lactamase superfamily II)
MRREFVLASVVLTGALVTAAATIAAQQAPAGAPAAQGQGRGDGRGRGDGQGRGGGRGGGGFGAVGMIEKVTDNVYMIPGAGGNSGVMVGANGVVLVDTKLANNGQAILDQIKTVTDKPVMTIINTHTHGDHNGSNMFFPATVEIVTHENTKANMEKMPAFQDAAGKVGMPDKTFKEKMSLGKGKEQIDLYYYGRSHTNGDTLVVFRNARVMHAGDMFANKGQGLIDPMNGGSGLEWGATIGKAAKGIKNVDKVITGHSTVMTWKDFVDYGEVNRLVAAYARDAAKAGKTPEQAMMEFKLPEKFTAAGYTFAAGGRGGPGGNFGIIFDELKAAK